MLQRHPQLVPQSNNLGQEERRGRHPGPAVRLTRQPGPSLGAVEQFPLSLPRAFRHPRTLFLLLRERGFELQNLRAQQPLLKLDPLDGVLVTVECVACQVCLRHGLLETFAKTGHLVLERRLLQLHRWEFIGARRCRTGQIGHGTAVATKSLVHLALFRLSVVVHDDRRPAVDAQRIRDRGLGFLRQFTIGLARLIRRPARHVILSLCGVLRQCRLREGIHKSVSSKVFFSSKGGPD
mmetsp:Transcript_4100/g.18615  ORF Transcript_4100/g.18615 Transcript_4100/m.18615 type:complete len:237 (+) Transcript_4100:933-1643(+)